MSEIHGNGERLDLDPLLAAGSDEALHELGERLRWAERRPGVTVVFSAPEAPELADLRVDWERLTRRARATTVFQRFGAIVQESPAAWNGLLLCGGMAAALGPVLVWLALHAAGPFAALALAVTGLAALTCGLLVAAGAFSRPAPSPIDTQEARARYYSASRGAPRMGGRSVLVGELAMTSAILVACALGVVGVYRTHRTLVRDRVALDRILLQRELGPLAPAAAQQSRAQLDEILGRLSAQGSVARVLEDRRFAALVAHLPLVDDRLEIIGRAATLRADLAQRGERDHYLQLAKTVDERLQQSAWFRGGGTGLRRARH
ncbi:MAG TPA: hypothetical protein VGV61_02560 [Thermoanaerobaculia bacterium]|jgi:hypothetical protein|nr:hypothetical protein [Thermoanaerobaculia bacterium]